MTRVASSTNCELLLCNFNVVRRDLHANERHSLICITELLLELRVIIPQKAIAISLIIDSKLTKLIDTNQAL
jgi:hypothetical protein